MPNDSIDFDRLMVLEAGCRDDQGSSSDGGICHVYNRFARGAELFSEPKEIAGPEKGRSVSASTESRLEKSFRR